MRFAAAQNTLFALALLDIRARIRARHRHLREWPKADSERRISHSGQRISHNGQRISPD